MEKNEKKKEQNEFIDYEFISSKIGMEQIRLGIILKRQWEIIDNAKRSLKNVKP